MYFLLKVQTTFQYNKYSRLTEIHRQHPGRVARHAGARGDGHQASALGLPPHRGRGDPRRGVARAPLQPVHLAGRRARCVAYHRCRGSGSGGSPLLLESIKSPAPDTFSLFRVDGSYPSFSHHSKTIAFVGLSGLFVVNTAGSGGRRQRLSHDIDMGLEE
jgi:hypothetical protein